MKAVTMGIVLAVTFAGVMASSARADNNGVGPVCDSATLRGEYVFTARGYNISAAGVPQPKAIVELIEFHGTGTLGVLGGTVSINGGITQIAAGGVGNYTLGPDCNGTLSFIAGPSFSLFVQRDGKSGWMIQTGAPAVFQGTLEQRK
jgi:hypothetical protein